VFKINRKRPAPDNETSSPWAVKRLTSQTKANEILVARLEQEAEILQKLNHPNIVGFRGKQKQSDGRLCLAMEEGGICLMDLIEDKKYEDGTPFPAKHIMKVALDIAKALDYLNEEHKLVHGDIKSQNILVKGDFEMAKLCDFGTSLTIGKDGVVQGEYHCSEPWSAPEVADLDDEESLKEKVPITSKADIFSYGLVIYEMLTLTTPHFNVDFDDTNSSFNEDSFYERVGNSRRLRD
jgi:PDZ-binding kinase